MSATQQPHPALSQRIEHELSFSSTNALISSLCSAGLGNHSLSDGEHHTSANRGSPAEKGQILTLLDAFSTILDISGSKTAVSSRQPVHRQTKLLWLELTVCGTCEPFVPRGASTPISPLNLVVERGPQVPLVEHAHTLNHFLFELSSSVGNEHQALNDLTRYIAASFAESVFERFDSDITSSFLSQLHALPTPSSITDGFPVRRSSSKELDRDLRLLDRFRRNSYLQRLSSLNLVHLPALAANLKDFAATSAPLYNPQTCDEIQRLLLFLLGNDTGYIGQISRFVREVRQGREAMRSNQWNRGMSKRFSRVCTKLTVYAVLLRDLVGSEAFKHHIQRMAKFLKIPAIDNHSIDDSRQGGRLVCAILAGNIVDIYREWIGTLIVHLQKLDTIQREIKYRRDVAAKKGRPRPVIFIRNVISIPREYTQHHAHRTTLQKWTEIVPGDTDTENSNSNRLTEDQTIRMLELTESALPAPLRRSDRETSSEDSQEPTQRNVFHPQLCLAILLSRHMRNYPGSEGSILAGGQACAIGSSSASCAGCSSAIDSLEAASRHTFLLGRSANKETLPLARSCFLPEWIPDSLVVQHILPRIRKRLRDLLDNLVCQESSDESAMSGDDDGDLDVDMGENAVNHVEHVLDEEMEDDEDDPDYEDDDDSEVDSDVDIDSGESEEEEDEDYEIELDDDDDVTLQSNSPQV
ncbi:hypothetical protein FA15DRAFT_669932 [Coprinopsis marcescibilis]|uniref:Uncharacterized protein n=1 Tax=Coprinopsis marcescibilis TaxID=230819 RepID=A0A5C3KUA5_COPMA|nr:hypothetical protein FA15DRAFT_669932 [Coprinopsis marcescibilis]